MSMKHEMAFRFLPVSTPHPISSLRLGCPPLPVVELPFSSSFVEEESTAELLGKRRGGRINTHPEKCLLATV